LLNRSTGCSASISATLAVFPVISAPGKRSNRS
jgi:hypothetical protein